MLLGSPPKPVDAFLTSFKDASWIGTLPFNGYLCLPSEDFCASSVMNHNLFEYTTTSPVYKGPMKFVVRFCPSLYPIALGFGKDSGGQSLITDLCQSARYHGNCALTSNGSGGRGRNNDQRILLCSNSRKYHSSLFEEKVTASTTEGTEDSNTYRVTTLFGTRKTLVVPTALERH